MSPNAIRRASRFIFTAVVHKYISAEIARAYTGFVQYADCKIRLRDKSFQYAGKSTERFRIFETLSYPMSSVNRENLKELRNPELYR